jgi:hypothetical protein
MLTHIPAFLDHGPQVADARADKAEESEKLNRALGDMERMASEHDQALRRAKDSQRKQRLYGREKREGKGRRRRGDRGSLIGCVEGGRLCLHVRLCGWGPESTCGRRRVTGLMPPLTPRSNSM